MVNFSFIIYCITRLRNTQCEYYYCRCIIVTIAVVAISQVSWLQKFVGPSSLRFWTATKESCQISWIYTVLFLNNFSYIRETVSKQNLRYFCYSCLQNKQVSTSNCICNISILKWIHIFITHDYLHHDTRMFLVSLHKCRNVQ